jgi:hypothetical protein
MNRKVAQVQIATPGANIVTALDPLKMNENDAGFVVNTDLECQKRGVKKYKIQNLEGKRFEAEIPSHYHYSEGDAVPENHIYNYRCLTCGNEKMYSEKAEEYYCPLGHDD